MTTQTPPGTPSADLPRRVPTKPLPLQENKGLTNPFWEAAKRHELVMQRCTKCANYIHFPREQCPVCFSQSLEWAKVSGNGRVYAFTNVHQAQNPAFQAQVDAEGPYTFAIVQLDEGPRMVTNIVGCSPDDVTCDMRVTAEFDDVNGDWTLVKFRPA